MQAYNFRLILSHDPANQVAYPKPAHYDPARFELLARLLGAMQHGCTCRRRGSPSARSPTSKADINNNGPFSTDYIGKSWDYPNATYQRRDEIWRDHEEYTKGFFWFLAHDPRVPPALQKEVNQWGLAKDEFTDNDHWPHQLYIREARRMVGEYVMTQKDIQTDLTKPDPIGMGSYNSDSHNVERVVNADGFVRNEGDMQVPVKPYQIPYRDPAAQARARPQPAGAGLLLGQPRGLQHAAHGAAVHDHGAGRGSGGRDGDRRSIAVQDIDTAALTRTLVQQGAILEYVPSTQTPLINRFHRGGR